MDGPWIKSNGDLGQHPKCQVAADYLSISVPLLIGHLHLFWHWCLKFAKDGNISRYRADLIASGSMWTGDPTQFIYALTTAGFIDEIDGTLWVHEWGEHGGNQRLTNAERQKKHREKHKTKSNEGVTQDSNDRNDNDALRNVTSNASVTRTVTDRNALEKNRIEKNREEENKHTSCVNTHAENFDPDFPEKPVVGSDRTDPKYQTEHFFALAETCDLHPERLKMDPAKRLLVAEIAKALEPEFTPDQIRLMRTAWPHRNAPTPKQVGTEIQKWLKVAEREKVPPDAPMRNPDGTFNVAAIRAYQGGRNGKQNGTG